MCVCVYLLLNLSWVLTANTGAVPWLLMSGYTPAITRTRVLLTFDQLFTHKQPHVLSSPCAGFCAPPTLTLSLQRSGGRLANSRGSSGPRRLGDSKAAFSSASATLHVTLTAAFWLDNRSGLNLVLSDLDRRWLKGLPGPGLKSRLALAVLVPAAHSNVRLTARLYVHSFAWHDHMQQGL